MFLYLVVNGVNFMLWEKVNKMKKKERKWNSPKLDRIRRDIIALFKEEGLSIIIETNFIETDSLDVTFNLATKKYFPFRKANNIPP